MKTPFIIGACFAFAIMGVEKKAQGQNQFNNQKNRTHMTDTVLNEEVIERLYNEALNKRNMRLLNDFISEDFVGVRGLKGSAGFEEPVKGLIKAFPDIQWNIQEVVSNDNKVVVRWIWKGTHKAEFQHYAITGKTFSNDGIGIYEFKDGKIISAQIQTDRLGFLQQMEAVPSDLTLLSNKRPSEGQVSFVDKFVIPQNSVDEFIRQMNYNRNFIKQQPGLVKSERYDQKDENGNLTILTVAVWQNQESLEKAKGAIQREFKRIGFNPQEFYKRLNITMERDMYVIAED